MLYRQGSPRLTSSSQGIKSYQRDNDTPHFSIINPLMNFYTKKKNELKLQFRNGYIFIRIRNNVIPLNVKVAIISQYIIFTYMYNNSKIKKICRNNKHINVFNKVNLFIFM